jgi:hypothetical protein
LELIEKVKTIDAHTAGGLEALVRKLAFEPVLDLLKKNEPSEGEERHD